MEISLELKSCKGIEKLIPAVRLQIPGTSSDSSAELS